MTPAGFDTTVDGKTAASFPTGRDPAARCLNCGKTGLDAFYRVDNIPVHSCLLVADRARANDFPTRDLQLGFCPSCGFIRNTLFDPDVHNYSALYEETQGFSATFNQFARSLAQRLIDRYDLHGKSILEIGCGKGEFLVTMCELGENRGVGVDPAYRPERTTSPAAERIEFIRDFYCEKYSRLTADFVCCRHTLEHIAPTEEFLRNVRKTLGDRTDTIVFFELPETMRILREGAFWDIYYEHCSYFTPGSLARLFRKNGFDLLELELDYDDQYILIVAQPTTRPTIPALPLEDDLSALREAVASFRQTCSMQISEWRDCIDQNAADGKRTVLWGSGSKGVAFLTTLGLKGRIEYVVDINPHKHGKFMPSTGQEIVGPEFLREYQPGCVIAMNPVYCEEIQQDLDRLGVKAELLAV